MARAYDSVVGCLPSMCEIQGSVCSHAKRKKEFGNETEIKHSEFNLLGKVFTQFIS